MPAMSFPAAVIAAHSSIYTILTVFAESNMILLFISQGRRVAGTVAYNFPVLLRCCIFPALINQALHRERSLSAEKAYPG